MSLFTALLPLHFGDATQRSLKDANYTVINPNIFNRAVFTGGKVAEGETLKCTGKNEGGWPQFERVNTTEKGKPLSMTYRAKGAPDSFGLVCEAT